MAQGLEFSPQDPRFRKLGVASALVPSRPVCGVGRRDRTGPDKAPVYLWYFVADQPGLIDEPQVPVRDIVLFILGLFCFK